MTLRAWTIGLLVLAAPAFASARPLDGSDATTVGAGAVQLELGSAATATGGERGGAVPVALAVGLLDRVDLFAGAELSVVSDGNPPGRDVALGEAAVGAKWLLRPGSLQARRGPSLGVEVAALLPGTDAPRGAGVSLSPSLSHALPALSLHLSGSLSRGPDGAVALGGAVGLEWLPESSARPLVELLVEREVGGARVASGLVGLAWDAADRATLDAAVRAGRDGGAPFVEGRLGVTLALRD